LAPCPTLWEPLLHKSAEFGGPRVHPACFPGPAPFWMPISPTLWSLQSWDPLPCGLFLQWCPLTPLPLWLSQSLFFLPAYDILSVMSHMELWHSTCLACTRTWNWFPVPQKVIINKFIHGIMCFIQLMFYALVTVLV
jgi:hypothetical protein